MTKKVEPREFSFKAVDGQINAKCPICSHEYFLDSGPDEDSERRGFVHVVMGVSGKNKLTYSVVRRKFCANCGYILQFMIPEGDAQK